MSSARWPGNLDRRLSMGPLRAVWPLGLVVDPSRRRARAHSGGMSADHEPNHCLAPNSSNRSTSTKASLCASRTEAVLALCVHSWLAGQCARRPVQRGSARLGRVPEAPSRGQEQLAELDLPPSRRTWPGRSRSRRTKVTRPVEHTFALNSEDARTVARDLRQSVLELGARPRPTEIAAYLRRRVQIDEASTVAALGLT